MLTMLSRGKKKHYYYIISKLQSQKLLYMHKEKSLERTQSNLIFWDGRIVTFFFYICDVRKDIFL